MAVYKKNIWRVLITTRDNSSGHHFTASWISLIFFDSERYCPKKLPAAEDGRVGQTYEFRGPGLQEAPRPKIINFIDILNSKSLDLVG